MKSRLKTYISVKLTVSIIWDSKAAYIYPEFLWYVNLNMHFVISFSAPRISQKMMLENDCWQRAMQGNNQVAVVVDCRCRYSRHYHIWTHSFSLFNNVLQITISFQRNLYYIWQFKDYLVSSMKTKRCHWHLKLFYELHRTERQRQGTRMELYGSLKTSPRSWPPYMDV